MMMIQFLIKTIINVMGKIYVFLDKRVKHDTSPILGLVIDYDLRDKSRKELCNHIEDKFKWERDSFWNLESTQKIRLCCQVARNTMSGDEYEL